jgi:hypothetical protein
MANAFQAYTYQQNAFQTNPDAGTLDQSQTSIAGGTGNINGGTDAFGAAEAQSFVPTTSLVEFVEVNLVVGGSPTDNTICEIQTNGATVPSGTVVGGSPTFPSASIPASSTWIRFPVDATVTAGVKYWIVIRRTIGGAGDSTNRPRYNFQTGNPYAAGGASFLNGTTGVWGAESGTSDIAFRVYGAAVVATKAPPFAPRTQRNFLIRR